MKTITQYINEGVTEIDIKVIKRIIKNQTKKGDKLVKQYYEERILPDIDYKAQYKGYGLSSDGETVTISIFNVDEFNRMKTRMMIPNQRLGYVYERIDIETLWEFANEIGLK